MEILFENSYTFDENIAREYMRYSFFRSARLYVIVAMYLIITAMLMLIRRFDYAAIFAVLFAVWIVISISSYRQGIRRMVRKNIEVSGGEPYPVFFDFAEECFFSNNSVSGSIPIRYSELKRVRESKKAIMLVGRGGTRYALDKSGFTKGSIEDFMRFIKRKVH